MRRVISRFTVAGIIFLIAVTAMGGCSMGTPVPPGWPEIDVTKFYWCTTDFFTGVPLPRDCTSTYGGRCDCCRSGQFIQDWLDADSECVFGRFLCRVDLPERLVCLQGPYNTIEECNAARAE